VLKHLASHLAFCKSLSEENEGDEKRSLREMQPVFEIRKASPVQLKEATYYSPWYEWMARGN
jgi:hypothetical protein